MSFFFSLNGLFKNPQNKAFYKYLYDTHFNIILFFFSTVIIIKIFKSHWGH